MEQQVQKVFCFCSNLIPNFPHLYLSLSSPVRAVALLAWAPLDVFIEFGDGLVGTLFGTQVPYVYVEQCDD